MKKFKYIFFTAALALALGSCKKFLDTKPTDSLLVPEYYDSETKLINALAGVYDPLGSGPLYAVTAMKVFDGYTDDCWQGYSTTSVGMEVYNFDFTDGNIRDFWANCYKGIDRANRLIANINVAEMDDTKRNVILGEALFLRGFYYFQLVTRFGGVPMRLTPVTSPTESQLERTPAAEVYDQILKDMKEAETKVAIIYPYASRVYKTVVQGMLARVCLHMAGNPLKIEGKYAEALEWAKKVKESNQHALNTSFDPKYTNNPYAQIFINHAQDKYDVKESMWEVEFKGNRLDGFMEGGNISSIIGPIMDKDNFKNDTGYCYGFIKASGLLYKLYGANDTLRRDWAIANYTYTYTANPLSLKRTPYPATTIAGRYGGKWRRSYETLTPKDKNQGPTNYPLLRYADVLLMYAEAENQVNNGPTAAAYEAVNMVRRRAFNVDLNVPNANADMPTGLDKTGFQKFIEDERSRELCFESLRRQDLVRWGKLIENLRAVSIDYGGSTGPQVLGGRNVEERHYLYPIPASEITLNKKIIQNPGW